MRWYRQMLPFAVLATVLTLAAVRPGMAGGALGVGKPTRTPFTLRALPTSHHSWQAPRVRNRNGTSTNWSGYAAYSTPTITRRRKTAPLTTFREVQGSWVVPEVTVSSSASTYSAAWVGIDGYATNTVEQIGTEQDWSGGRAQYYAWFEMYPRGAYEIVGFPVSPGDTISAEVAYLSKGLFTLTITNQDVLDTNGDPVTFSITQRLQSAQRLSAEWVMEAPWWGGVLPLADFGTISFLDCSAVTDSGQTVAVGTSSSLWQSDQMTMETADGIVKAEPSSAHNGGFTVTWAHE